MIGCSASWIFTSLPNSVGLLALPLRMISVLGSKRLTSFPATRVSPSSTRALVCRITCWTRGSITSSSCFRPSSAACCITSAPCFTPLGDLVDKPFGLADDPAGHRQQFLVERLQLLFAGFAL